MPVLGGGDDLPLRARGLVADTATAALVAADGTLEWWCPDRLDAPAAFFRLLDPAGGGLRVGPSGEPRAGQQSYDEGTMVLRTELSAPGGALEVTDLMPWEGGWPAGRIVRIVAALSGAVDVEVAVVPGFRFGSPEKVSVFADGVAFDKVVVRAGCDMEGLRGRRRLEAGERMVVTVDPPGSPAAPLSVEAALQLVERTATAWRMHVAPLSYEGPFRDEVARSLLVLKALTWGRTGAPAASVTTSLPQHEGGERNWDARHAWVRDAALGVVALSGVGLPDEAARLAGWLEGLVQADWPLAPVVSLEGGAAPDESELPRLGGWRRSQPVRVGHVAGGQLHLDLVADIVAALDPPPPAGLPSWEEAGLASPAAPLLGHWRELAGMADWVSDSWGQPDHGIWELRSGARQLVASKLACWWALDRMARLAWARSPLDLDAAGWKLAAKEVLDWVEEHGVDRAGGWRAEAAVPGRGLDGGGGAGAGGAGGAGGGEPRDLVDAGLLRVVRRSPWPPDHPRVAATLGRVMRDLSTGPFVHPYPPEIDDGLPPGQGASVAASFWAVEALAGAGRWDEAHDRMEGLCRFAGPLGLLPEQADPATGAFLGNLPFARSHLALVGAARSLARGPR